MGVNRFARRPPESEGHSPGRRGEEDGVAEGTGAAMGTPKTPSPLRCQVDILTDSALRYCPDLLSPCKKSRPAIVQDIGNGRRVAASGGITKRTPVAILMADVTGFSRQMGAKEAEIVARAATQWTAALEVILSQRDTMPRCRLGPLSGPGQAIFRAD